MMTDGHQAVLAAARSWVDAADEPGRERVRVAVLEALRSVNGLGDGSELAALDAAIAANLKRLGFGAYREDSWSQR